jgi:hypothetical protein
MTSLDSAYFKDKLRARSRELRSEIHDTLLRADAETFARIAGEVRDAEEDAVADLLVDVNMAEITRDVGRQHCTALPRARMGCA